MLASFLALAVAAAPAASTASCPTEPTRIVEDATVAFPEAAHATHGRVRFLVDIGSDGRVRRTALVESSGDAALDAAAGKALSASRYAAPSRSCAAISTVATRFWDLPADAVAAATPPASAPPAVCSSPFVRPVRLQLPQRRKSPGTVAVDVSLDRDARVTAVHLAQSSGNAKTDYAATAAARGGRFMFERQPGCPAAATTYRFEMTFR